MRVYLQGVGAFGPGFANWSELQAILDGESSDSALPPAPKPSVIPANERRRAPMAVRIAVETCSQAVAMSGIDPKDAACVFASGHGDTQLTDYMCRELAGEHKQLSPTKFHNSVHNAAAGYWTIATGCRQPANSVAGLHQSVAVTLLEAMSQCVCEQQPVLLAFYDTPTAAALSSLLPNEHAFGMALVITPGDDSGRATALTSAVTNDVSDSAYSETLPATLSHLVAENPAAKALLLAQALTRIAASSVTLTLGQGSALRIDIRPPSALLAGK